jgi:hypothetical protein
VSASKVKARDAAYRLVARAVLGDPFPDELGDETVAYAFELVLGDTRKSRTTRERSVQQMVAAALVVQQFVKDPGAFARMSAPLVGSVLGELLKPGDILEPRGEEVDP